MNQDKLAINAIRVIAAEAVQKANSGHPGLPMGAAPVGYALYADQMVYNPQDPNWINRDRFILSAGHGSMLVYSLLHLFGFGLTMEDIKNFRQLGSKTPGHPEFGHTVGVETTTGPLGAGFSTAVGMAVAEANLAAKFNKSDTKLIDHYTFVVMGDGCHMEGITGEAASFAGSMKLGKLIALYDSNRITIEGSTDITFTEDVAKRYEAYEWQVLHVENGDDLEEINAAITKAKANLEQPTLIIVRSEIGFGCPAKQGKHSAHGEPLGDKNIEETKANLGYNYPAFTIPEEVYAHVNSKIADKVVLYKAWHEMKAAYAEKYPEDYALFESYFDETIAEKLIDDESFWTFDHKKNATRNISGEIINKLAAKLPNFLGGSADLAPSTKTYMNGKGDFSSKDYTGMNMHFGVREHAMSAIGNGIVLHGGFKSFVSTFFVFSDYLKPGARLSAIMKQPLTYVLTHDSIGVGEDGPTHQPIEQLIGLRSIPNFVTYRPADAKETAAAWYFAITSKTQPTAIVLTRQNLPYYEESSKDALKGGYVLLGKEYATPDIILMASGSEVEFVYEAAKKLIAEGVKARVVSMPSLELFNAQSDEYKANVLPLATRKRIAVEAARDISWFQYVGLDGKVIGINTFGESAPAELVFEKFGLTTENVYAEAKALLK